MAGKSINELPEITSVSDSSLMALSSDGKTLGRVAARTLKNSVVGQHISNYIRYINQDTHLHKELIYSITHPYLSVCIDQKTLQIKS